MITLSFSAEYLSIVDFAPVVLPDFVVLTGVNGAGKSHLLAAIKNGKIHVDGRKDTDGIILFNNQTFRINNESTYSATQIIMDRQHAWNHFSTSLRRNILPLRLKAGESYIRAKQNALKIMCRCGL